MKNILLTLFILSFLPACQDDDVRLRKGSAPTEQKMYADDLIIQSPIPADIASTYQLDTNYYKKVIMVWGNPVLAPENVDDVLLKNAAEIVALQLSDDSLQADLQVQIRDKLYQHYFGVVIFASGEHSSGSEKVPGYSGFAPANGYSATKTDPFMLATEHSVDYANKVNQAIIFDEQGSVSKGNSLIHELTHSIHLLALRDLILNFDEQLKTAYQNMIDKRLWAGSSYQIAASISDNNEGMGYISTDYLEYLAVGSELWHNVRGNEAVRLKADGQSLHEHLRENDFELYNILSQVYQSDFTLNSSASMYAGHINLTCKIDRMEFNNTYGSLNLNWSEVTSELYKDNKVFSISQLSLPDEREAANAFFMNNDDYVLDEFMRLSMYLPDPNRAPSYYRGDHYRLSFNYQDKFLTECEVYKADLIE